MNTIIVHISGGTAPYTIRVYIIGVGILVPILWDTFVTFSIGDYYIYAVPTGEYNVICTDANGCEQIIYDTFVSGTDTTTTLYPPTTTTTTTCLDCTTTSTTTIDSGAVCLTIEGIYLNDFVDLTLLPPGYIHPCGLPYPYDESVGYHDCDYALFEVYANGTMYLGELKMNNGGGSLFGDLSPHGTYIYGDYHNTPTTLLNPWTGNYKSRYDKVVLTNGQAMILGTSSVNITLVGLSVLFAPHKDVTWLRVTDSGNNVIGNVCIDLAGSLDVVSCFDTTTTTTSSSTTTTTTIYIPNCEYGASNSAINQTSTTTTSTSITTTTTTTIFGDCIEYGLLYNWYAAIDIRNIAPVGFHVPTRTELGVLITYLGDSFIAGGHLKEIGTTHWTMPNAGADNSSGFNGVGSGYRYSDGGFTDLLDYYHGWLSSTHTDYTPDSYILRYYDGSIYYQDGFENNKEGRSLRFIADSGTPTIVIGNDGKVYPCVTIGSQTWTATNSSETKYRNNDDICEVQDNTIWANLTTGAMCAYDNNYANVGCEFAGGVACTTTTTSTSTSTSTTTTTTTMIEPTTTSTTTETPTTTTTTTVGIPKAMEVLGGETHDYIGDSTGGVTIPFSTGISVIVINTYDPTTRGYSVPNIDGVDMTQVNGYAGVNRLDAWYLVNPPTSSVTVTIPGAGANGNVGFTLINIQTTGITMNVYDHLYQSGSGTSISQTIAKPINEFNLCVFSFILLSAVNFVDLIEGVTETTVSMYYATIGTTTGMVLNNGTYQGAEISFRTDNNASITSSAVMNYTYAFNWETLGICFYAI